MMSRKCTNLMMLRKTFTGIDSFFSSLFDFYDFYDADIVNNSYGFSGNIIDYTEAQVRNAFPNTIAVNVSRWELLITEQNNICMGCRQCWGLCRSRCRLFKPRIIPGMAHYIPEIQGHSIAVASLMKLVRLVTFSSRCGVAQGLLYCCAWRQDVTVAYPLQLGYWNYIEAQ